MGPAEVVPKLVVSNPSFFKNSKKIDCYGGESNSRPRGWLGHLEGIIPLAAASTVRTKCKRAT